MSGHLYLGRATIIFEELTIELMQHSLPILEINQLLKNTPTTKKMYFEEIN